MNTKIRNGYIDRTRKNRDFHFSLSAILDSRWLTLLLESRNVNKFADKEIKDFSFLSSGKGSLHVLYPARVNFFSFKQRVTWVTLVPLPQISREYVWHFSVLMLRCAHFLGKFLMKCFARSRLALNVLPECHCTMCLFELMGKNDLGSRYGIFYGFRSAASRYYFRKDCSNAGCPEQAGARR